MMTAATGSDLGQRHITWMHMLTQSTTMRCTVPCTVSSDWMKKFRDTISTIHSTMEQLAMQASTDYGTCTC